MSSENRQMSQQPSGGGMQGFPFLGMQQGGQMPNMQQFPGLGAQPMPGMGGMAPMSGMGGMPPMPGMSGMAPMPGMGGMMQVPTASGGPMPTQFPSGGLQNPNLVTPSMPPMSSAGPGDMLPMEQSYIENILRLNKGKLATVYMTFEGAKHKSFTGIIEAAGRDHIILSDRDTGIRYLLLMVYVDYITFPEEIEYSYPFGVGPMSTYPPR